MKHEMRSKIIFCFVVIVGWAVVVFWWSEVPSPNTNTVMVAATSAFQCMSSRGDSQNTQPDRYPSIFNKLATCNTCKRVIANLDWHVPGNSVMTFNFQPPRLLLM